MLFTEKNPYAIKRGNCVRISSSAYVTPNFSKEEKKVPGRKVKYGK